MVFEKDISFSLQGIGRGPLLESGSSSYNQDLNGSCSLPDRLFSADGESCYFDSILFNIQPGYIASQRI